MCGVKITAPYPDTTHTITININITLQPDASIGMGRPRQAHLKVLPLAPAQLVLLVGQQARAQRLLQAQLVPLAPCNEISTTHVSRNMHASSAMPVGARQGTTPMSGPQ